jgi:hypothetical protein
MKTARRGTRWPLLATLLLAACSGSGGPSEETPTGDVFLAFADDFRGYHSWEGFDVTEGAAATGVHDATLLMAYLNSRPQSGSEAFPVGTMIVKEPTGGTTPPHIFAMAKRGGGYNATVPGWEWFELENLVDGSDGVRVVWRGVGPPAGEMYGGDPNAGCNTCHSACPDGVCSPPLALSGF